MDVLDLMIVDKVSSLIMTENNDQYNIGHLTKGAYQVALPKDVEVGDTIIHIRPSTIIKNPNIKIPKEYWSEKLNAYLSVNRYFKNRRINSIVIKIDDLDYNDEFKKLLEVGNPVFPENPLSDRTESLDYFNRYGIVNLEEYLFFTNHLKIEYKPSRFKFLNPFTLVDRNYDSNAEVVQNIVNGLNPIDEKDKNGNDINYVLSINKMFHCFYSGIVFDRINDKIHLMVRLRSISFEYSKLNKVIKKYTKLVEKAKKEKEGNYLDEAILYILGLVDNLRTKLLNNISRKDGELICIGGPLIGKKVLDNRYQMDCDYKLILNFLFINSLKEINENHAVINTNALKNIGNYLKDCEEYHVVEPAFITSYNAINNIFDNFNKGVFEFVYSDFINKYLISSYSEKKMYPWLQVNPRQLELTCVYTTEDDDVHTQTFIIDDEEYKEYFE